jgi:hypothetical protein
MDNNTFENETDNESYDSWNETHDEADDIIYEPEEPSLNKFTIVLCEKYNRLLHGPAPIITKNYYLTFIRLKQLDMNLINYYKGFSDSLKLEIAECIYLPSQHCVSIIKTFWLKLIQRKWKNIYKEKKICILRRSNPNCLLYREITGKWPNDCLNYPGLKGMLSELS